MRSFFRPTPETFSPLPPGCRFHRIQRPQGQGHYTTESGIFKCFFAQAPLKGELPPQRLRGAVGSYVFMKSRANSQWPPLASPGGKLDFLAIGTSEPIAKKD